MPISAQERARIRSDNCEADLTIACEAFVKAHYASQDTSSELREIEKALERFQLARSWFVCKHCEGTGLTHTGAYTVDAQRLFGEPACENCGGEGLVNGLD